jgi:hypothetical protein
MFLSRFFLFHKEQGSDVLITSVELVFGLSSFI